MKMENEFLPFIKKYQDFPKPGVTYWDFTPMLEHPEVLKSAVSEMKENAARLNPTRILSIEAKGFIIGALLASELGLPMTLVRKPGVTPGQVKSAPFVKEYGEGMYEIKEGAVKANDRVLIVYDILAAPGAAQAAMKLALGEKARIAGLCFMIELEYLGARRALEPVPVFSLVKIQNA